MLFVNNDEISQNSVTDLNVIDKDKRKMQKNYFSLKTAD